MKAKSFLRSFVIIFALCFVVAAVVSYLYSLIAHREGVVDWEVAFRMGLILGIVIPLIPLFEKK
jgi:hypothetical protein